MSSNTNKGLGKGLAALIGDHAAANRLSEEKTLKNGADADYQQLAVDQIEANPSQPRTLFNNESLRELADSIKAVGLVQPVLVRRSGGRYEIVAGERRWRAAKMAGLKTIPAVIREAGDTESLKLALIENINREDLNAMDAARAYANLQEEFGSTQEELAAELGRSRSAIANTIRLLDLPDEVQHLIEQGRLSEGHGRTLLSLNDRLRQKKLAAQVVARGLSVRQTEALVKKELTGKKTSSPADIPVSQEIMNEAIDAFYATFQLPAKVRWSGNTGKVELQFKNEKQLIEMIGLLAKRTNVTH